MQFQVTIPNKFVFDCVKKWARENGYKCNFYCFNGLKSVQFWNDMSCTHCCEDAYDKARFKLLTIEELFTMVPKKKETVKLSEDYSAIISEDGVKVGCQNFSREVSLKLANTILEVMT